MWRGATYREEERQLERPTQEVQAPAGSGRRVELLEEARKRGALVGGWWSAISARVTDTSEYPGSGARGISFSKFGARMVEKKCNKEERKRIPRWEEEEKDTHLKTNETMDPLHTDRLPIASHMILGAARGNLSYHNAMGVSSLPPWVIGKDKAITLILLQSNNSSSEREAFGSTCYVEYSLTTCGCHVHHHL